MELTKKENGRALAPGHQLRAPVSADSSAAYRGRKPAHRAGGAQVGSEKKPERVQELIPVLKEMQHRRGGDLSGGQQQQLWRLARRW